MRLTKTFVTRVLRQFNIPADDPHLMELLKGGSIAFTSKIIGIPLSYLFVLLITRNFGANGMGIYALCLTVLGIFTMLGGFGFDTALLRFISEHSSQNAWGLVKDTYFIVFWVVIPLSLLLSILLYLSAPYIAKYIFGKDHLYIYFQIASIGVLPTILFRINSESIRALKKIMEYSFLINISIPLFGSILLFFLIIFVREPYIPLLAYILALISAFILSSILWFRVSGIRSIIRSNSIKLRTILDVSFPMLFASSLTFIIAWTDILMLGIMGTERDVGIYTVAVRIAALTTLPLIAINTIAAPKFAEFYGKGDIKGLGKIAQQSTLLIFWISLPILLLCFAFPSFILGVFGSDFTAGVYALLLLVLGQFINAIAGSVGYILQMTGKHNMFKNIVLVATVINIVLNVLLIPKYGINGAAFASMVSIAFLNLTFVFYIYKYYGFLTLYIPFLSSRVH